MDRNLSLVAGMIEVRLSTERLEVRAKLGALLIRRAEVLTGWTGHPFD